MPKKNNGVMTNQQLKDIGEQTIKRGRGRPKGTGGNRRPDSTVQTEPGDNTKYINHSMRLANLPKIDIDDKEQVANRINEYFSICAQDDMKPSVIGLAVALDIDRRRLWEIREGVRGGNKEARDLLKKAMSLLELQMNDYMQNGKINPVSAIFLSKNHFGYADKQEVVVTPQSPLGEGQDVKQIEDRYKESIVVDAIDDDTADGAE